VQNALSRQFTIVMRFYHFFAQKDKRSRKEQKSEREREFNGVLYVFPGAADSVRYAVTCCSLTEKKLRC
jgi:hypothetical protein